MWRTKVVTAQSVLLAFGKYIVAQGHPDILAVKVFGCLCVAAHCIVCGGLVKKTRLS